VPDGPTADGENLAEDHLPAHCCRHVFTAGCPIDCLQAVLGTATFHALARAERAPFDPPATVGQVLELLRAGRLGLAGDLGPRRLGEIQAGLVLAGLVVGLGGSRAGV
jgi:hypothetical protein